MFLSKDILLKSLNYYSNKFADLEIVRNKLLNENISEATDLLYDYYLNSKQILKYATLENYFCDEDILKKNIQEFSTAVTIEDLCYSFLDNNAYNSPTAAGRRLGRILRTFWH